MIGRSAFPRRNVLQNRSTYESIPQASLYVKMYDGYVVYLRGCVGFSHHALGHVLEFFAFCRGTGEPSAS